MKKHLGLLVSNEIFNELEKISQFYGISKTQVICMLVAKEKENIKIKFKA